MSFMLWATGVFFVSSRMTYRTLNVRTESSVLIAPPPLFSSKSEIIRTPHCLEGVVCCLQGERDVMLPAPRDRTRVSPSLRIFAALGSQLVAWLCCLCWFSLFLLLVPCSAPALSNLNGAHLFSFFILLGARSVFVPLTDVFAPATQGHMVRSYIPPLWRMPTPWCGLRCGVVKPETCRPTRLRS